MTTTPQSNPESTLSLRHRGTFRTVSLLAVLLVAAWTLGMTAFAGGGPGPSGPVDKPGTGVPAVDPSQSIVLEGPVVSFLAGPGSTLPTLIVDDAALGATTVRLGPYWFLADAGFTASAGDTVRLTAYPCSLCSAGYVAATLENLSTGVSVTLRAEDGTPLWPGQPRHGAVAPGPGRGDGMGAGMGPDEGSGAGHGSRGSGCSGACAGWTFDFSAALTVTGTVVAFTGGPGVGMPLLTLEADGETLVLVAGPWYVWQAAGYLPGEGDVLEVTYVPTHQNGEDFLVLTQVVEAASGLTVILRDPEAVRSGCPRR